MRNAWLATIMVAGIVGGVWFYIASDDPFISACEDVFTPRLRSPSTYKQASAGPVIRAPTTLQEFQGMDLVSVLVRYDAANAFGTPVRGIYLCEIHLKPGEAIGPMAKFQLKVDGLSATEWELSEAERLLGEAEGLLGQ